MTNDDIGYISGTETCRSASNLFFVGAVIFLIYHEASVIDSLVNWMPSIATPIVLGLLGVGFRLVAIDRFLRMARQEDYETRRPSNSE